MIDFVGDVHGCFDELLALLVKLGYSIQNGQIQPSNRRLIFVGDLIDKGPKTPQVIDFIYNNLNRVQLVLGNHENFVYKFITGKLTETGMPPGVQEQYFDSSFIADPIFKAQLTAIVKQSMYFIEGENFIVTHAPCESQYLGRTDRKSLKNQNNIRYPRHEKTDSDEEFITKTEGFFNYLITEANSSHPYHIFGHVPMLKPLQLGNKIGIDTGCVQGGSLTAVTLPDLTFTSEPCHKPGGYQPDKKLLDLFGKTNGV